MTTSTDVGATIESNGVTERSFPDGTLAQFIRPTLTIDTTAGFSNSATDIKIRRLWVESYPWYICRARIDLRRGYDGQGIRHLLDRLRIKQNGPLVQIDVTGVQGYEGGFQGIVREVRDNLVISKEVGGGVGYVVDVFIERFRYLSSEDIL